MERSKLLKNLNPEQIKAVTHKKGPLLIIAGAGTGKTTVITHRIAWLIEQKLARPEEILALTFTEKAAAEMEQRVDVLVPYGFVDTWISTFHAFGDRLLRDWALETGLPANFKVLSETEQAIFIKDNIYAFDLKYFRPVANPISHIEAMLKHFSRLKDELISPEEYVRFAQNQKQTIEAEKTLELANVYQRYSELMLQNGNLDFGDQVFLTYKLLKNNPGILKKIKEKFKYILVDEFQDTNYAQNEIVKLLAGKQGNITVVGDDDQAIYRFRGASISNILDFKKYYPQSKQVILNQNYRSTQEILDASYKLIQHNNPYRLEIANKINKKLISSKHGTIPELIFCSNLSCEADSVKEKISQLKTRGYKYKDIAILVRANSHAEPFMQSLNISGIPYIFSGASGLFQQPEIKILISFLKCLVYRDDNLAFYQLATSELYNVSHQILTDYYAQAARTNRTIAEIFEKNKTAENDKIKEIIQDLKKYTEKKNDPAGEVLYEYLMEKKYLKKLSADLNIENELKIYNIAKFFDKISQFNHSSQDQSIPAFLNHLETLLDFGEEIAVSDIDPDLDAINILTVHAAKGLEWRGVFVVNCVSDRFPSRNRNEQLPIPEILIKENLPEGDFHLQEERRLFYVAATRAKDFLYLTAAEDYGGKRVKKLSPFVFELLDESVKEKIKNKLSPLEKIAKFKKIKQQFARLPSKFQDKILRLSRQQIDDYFSCPKKFYFAHIVKIPLLENRYLMYGTAIHAALDHYFRRKINKEQILLETLLEDYRQAFKNIGFITREHEDKMFKNGLNTLSKFFNEDQKNQQPPYQVEASFEFLQDNIKINGRYDLVYKINNSYEICDFKTSDVREQKDADRRIKESTQMMIYALAWYKKFGQIPKTTLYFIESNLKGETTFALEDLKKTKQMIEEASRGIRKNIMTAKPNIFQCRQCPYRDICPESA